MGIDIFEGVFKGKRVVVTGHTGFKGTWLITWLLQLGAEVCGISDEIPTNPSMFSKLKLEDKIDHNIIDIRSFDELSRVIVDYKPDFLFHLAAQAIVSSSYSDPLKTIETNVMGTAHVLESLKLISHDCAAVLITSDKCYENVEWPWGYKETDHLGGRDIYSGSKGAAEVIFHSYFYSFFNKEATPVRIATGRAGNVIGGGDWAKDRIVPDCMRVWSNDEKVEIRSPNATRPWQHVLEPLSGYLMLAYQLSKRKELNGEQFNFGPKSEQNRTVKDLLDSMSRYWNFEKPEDSYDITSNIPFHEAGLLKLNCDKALFHLKWESNWTYTECVKNVSDWYYKYYNEDIDMYAFTQAQITSYVEFATRKELVWTKNG